MFNAGKHIVHVANGRLAPDSSTTGQDVRNIVSQALASNAASGIVVHFHGGLVKEQQARDTARDQLYPLYAERSQAYPVFFVWESGFFEAVRNNLHDIGKESLFQEFMKKAGEWLLKYLPDIGGGKGGAGGGSVNEARLRAEFDDWFNGRRTTPPDELQQVPGAHPAAPPSELAALARSKGAVVDERDLEANIADSIEGDPDFQDAVVATYNGLHPAGETQPTLRGVGTSAAENSLISKEAADRLFGAAPATPGVTEKGFGPLAWWRVAKGVAAIVMRGLQRAREGRHHGLYLTLVEETLRELYLDKLGSTVWWNAMKKDTTDAFQDGQVYGGTAFLYELHSQLQGRTGSPGNAAPRITLVGHSAGAIYVCNFLAAASRWLPDTQFDVIFEAPAATHALLAETVAAHGRNIAHFRQFAMSDELETADQLMPVVYPGSMLYFISGLLESSVDEPLVGMERYLRDAEIYSAEAFPALDATRRFYDSVPGSLVWSPAEGAPGHRSTARHHGGFDAGDELTMGSVQHLLQHGF